MKHIFGMSYRSQRTCFLIICFFQAVLGLLQGDVLETRNVLILDSFLLIPINHYDRNSKQQTFLLIFDIIAKSQNNKIPPRYTFSMKISNPLMAIILGVTQHLPTLLLAQIWYNNKNNQKMNSQSSEDEGFYKPAIQITQPTPILPTQFTSLTIQQQFDNAIDIITEDRPVDFIPRLLNSDIKYYTCEDDVNGVSACGWGEFMDPITYNVKDNKEIKEKRYKSLQAKYKNNPDYQLVYSKIPENSQFSSYIFSLQNTPDYNPNDFTPISSQILPDSNIFDSRFESGNLLYAYNKKNSQYGFPQYDLIMQNDTNTKGFSQWFYFTVRNKQCKKMKLNIVNFIKKNLMFLDGVRPVAYSRKAYEKNKKGWEFVGNNCTYGKSFITREIAGNPPQFKNYYTFSFEINFSERDDLVYIALNFPYTYTRMLKHTQNLINTCPEEISIQKNILCHTISNNPIPYLVIQHKALTSENKKTILCLARQHPGQTVGSYVLEAFLNNLMLKSKILLEYKFVVVPMVNPDGVIYGNFRTNLAGFDLNRQWNQPNRWLHPQIFFLSKLIPIIGEIQFCMDFHGHSKKMNSFIYACFGQKINDFRLYPYIFSQKCDLFSLKDCTYNISIDKIKTARVNVFNQVKKPYIYTLQTSFYGHTKENKNQRFTLTDFETIGKGAVEGLEILMLDKKALIKIEGEVKDKNYLFQQWAMQNRQDDGSQSNPSEDQLNPIERKAKVMSDVKARKPVKKFFKRKSKKKDKSLGKKKKSIAQYLLKQKADSAMFMQDRKSQKKIPINIKSSESSGIITVDQNKKKAKSQAKKQISQTNIEPKLKPPPPIIPRPQQIKTFGSRAPKPEQKSKLNTTNSNLFDTANYLKMREQVSMELRKVEQPKLQISCFSKKEEEEITTAVSKSSRFHQLQVQRMKKQLEQLAPVYTQPKKKSMEKVYIIKQNKVVSSITRFNEEQMRRNIQRQISNRTMALKNCQKIMSTFAIEKVSKSSVDSHEFVQQDPYKTRKLLRPLDIKRHRNFNGFKDEQRSGVFFSFLGN